MSTLLFDTFEAAKKLEGAGFNPTQTEVLVRTIHHAVNENVATKADLKAHMEATTAALKAHMEATTAALKAHMEATETKLTLKIELLRRDMIIWLGGIVIATGVVLSGVMFALLKMFIPGT